MNGLTQRLVEICKAPVVLIHNGMEIRALLLETGAGDGSQETIFLCSVYHQLISSEQTSLQTELFLSF